MSLKPALRPYNGVLPRVGKRVWIDPSAQIIGQVELEEDVSIWPNVVLRGDVHFIRVGKRSNIQDGCIGHVTHDGPWTPGGLPLLIGRDVTIGHGAIVHACTIGDRCLIGMGALVMDGAIIEDEVLLGAGSLVSPGKRLRSGMLYRGQPARAARELTSEELTMLRYSAEHYTRLKDRYLQEQGEQ